jgi:hypothetical protein
MNDESFAFCVNKGALIVQERERKNQENLIAGKLGANQKAAKAWEELFNFAYSTIPSCLLDLYTLQYPIFNADGYMPSPELSYQVNIELPKGKIGFNFYHAYRTTNGVKGYTWELSMVSYESFRMEYPYNWTEPELIELCKRMDTESLRNVKPEKVWIKYAMYEEDADEEEIEDWINELLYLAEHSAWLYGCRQNDCGNEHQICAMYAESALAAQQQQEEQLELMAKAFEPEPTPVSEATPTPSEQVWSHLCQIMAIYRQENTDW